MLRVCAFVCLTFDVVVVFREGGGLGCEEKMEVLGLFLKGPDKVTEVVGVVHCEAFDVFDHEQHLEKPEHKYKYVCLYVCTCMYMYVHVCIHVE